MGLAPEANSWVKFVCKSQVLEKAFFGGFKCEISGWGNNV